MPPGTSRAPELTTEICAHTFKYTIGGQVARRTDQRGVTLDFHFGMWAGRTAGGPTLVVNQVTGVEVACPSPLPVDRSLPDTVDYLTHDCDAVGRRVPKTVGTGDDPTDYFYYDGHRALEHHTNDGTALTLHRRYVYRLDYIDEVVAYQSTVRFGVAGPPFHPLLPRGERGGSERYTKTESALLWVGAPCRLTGRCSATTWATRRRWTRAPRDSRGH